MNMRDETATCPSPTQKHPRKRRIGSSRNMARVPNADPKI
jgi:hypothetical protein